MKRLAWLLMAMTVGITQAFASDFQGTTSGTFTNPVGPPGMVYSYSPDHSSFSWGTPSVSGYPANNLSFTGTPFSGNFGSEFKIGSLRYYNGSVLSGTEATSIDLSTALMFTSPTGITKNFLFNFSINNTTNTTDPVASADYVTLMNAFDPSTTFSYNGNDYFLEFTRFAATDSFGFSPDAKQFHVYEDQAGTADLYAKLTTDPGQPVPEPGTLALLGIGMAGLVMVQRRRSKKA